jgi:hypothetical protein
MRFLFDRPLSRTRAWTCVLTNLAATPGLGSLMGRRFFAGAGQLILALAGFFLMLGWMFKLFYRVFQEQLGGPVPQNSSGWMLKWGLIVFGAGWLWSLVTSVSLLWEAKMDERKNLENVPPKLAD